MPTPTTPLARAARASARLALWTSLVVSSLAALLLARWGAPLPVREIAFVQREQARWQGIDFASLPEVRMLRELVGIDTSPPNPDEIAAAEYLAAQLGAAGVRATIERFTGRRANLWAFVEGEDPRALVLHGHLDVDPLLEEGPWKHPPLSGAIDGPWIYGRGMYDMKSLTVAQLLAVRDVAASGRRPRRSLLFLATSGEEVGSDLGTRWILDQHPELVARMGTVLTEGGVIEARSPIDIKYWGVEFAQKHFVRHEFCSPRRSDLQVLTRVLRELGGGDPVPGVDPAVLAFLDAYGPTRDSLPFQKLLARPELLPFDAQRFAELGPFLQSLFRDEVVPLRVERDEAGGWKLTVVLHLLPASDTDAVRARLLPDWATHGFAPPAISESGSRKASPIDHADFRTMVETIAARHPAAPVGPYFLPWASTDARFFRELDLPAYGVSPFVLIATETTGVGKANERMQLPSFVDGVELYRELVRALVD